MSDLKDWELENECAKALGWTVPEGMCKRFNPLNDDAQAMALVKRFDIRSQKSSFGIWHCRIDGAQPFASPTGNGANADLNRAIVECVARMQAAGPKVTA